MTKNNEATANIIQSSRPDITDWSQPFQLFPIFRERIWGRKDLAPFFRAAPSNSNIGEVWFSFSENQTSRGISLGELLKSRPEILGSGADPAHPGICPLLVKLLFTTERLSVQVHPDDEYAQARHNSLGKTEAWYVIDSRSPGEVAVGFRETLTPEGLRSAAMSGEIEKLLDWRRVHAGDVVFVPAGTVHAIGAGLTICEIQENSDITYRLYDYGRDRELHLEDGTRVSHLGSHEWRSTLVALAAGRDELLANKYFRIERLRPRTSVRIAGGMPHCVLLICLKGAGTIAGQPFEPGQCWLVPAQNSETTITGPGSEWIMTYTSPESNKRIYID
jgi:mannose-6-phosphate isomerase